MSSVAQKATSTSLLLRPDRLYSFLDAATESITTDSELSTTSLAGIANSIRSIGLDKVEFVTVPNETYPPDPNRVQWTAEADLLWEAIRQDRPLHEDASTATPSQTESAVPSEPLTVSPDEIAVTVQNGSGVSGLARQTVSALAVQGFVAMPGADLPGGEIEGTVIRHTEAMAEAARTVQAAFPGSTLVEDDAAGEAIVVQLGAGARNPVEVPNRLGLEPRPPMPISAEQVGAVDPSSTASIPVRTAADDICS